MCYLIHVGVPESHAAAVPHTRVPRIARQDNPSIAAAFGPSFVPFSIADGGCACKLYSPLDVIEDDHDPAANKRRKYERLGWSPAKIARALATSEDARPKTAHRSGIRQDVAALVANLADTAGEVRLLVHEYRGFFAEETVAPGPPSRLNADEFRASAYAAVAEDIVYTIAGR